MNYDKFALKSKTIIGALLAMLTVIAPELGLTFTGEDGQLISELWDNVLITMYSALAIWGRFAATKPLRLKPK